MRAVKAMTATTEMSSGFRMSLASRECITPMKMVSTPSTGYGIRESIGKTLPPSCYDIVKISHRCPSPILSSEKDMLTAYLSLAKPRIVGLVTIAILTAAIVASKGNLTVQATVLLILAGGIAAAGAAFLNNYFDRDVDVIMERTKRRPLPSGKVSPAKVFVIGVVLIALSVPIALRLNYLVALFILAGALVYSFVYTLWLKRRTSLNIVIGGLAGSCAVLAGWFAAAPFLSVTPVLIAFLVFLWTPSHFWCFAIVQQSSYGAAKVPMLPVLAGTARTTRYILLSTSLLFIVSLLIYFTGPFRELYLTVAALLGVAFVATNLALVRRQTDRLAWLNFKLSGVYLVGLFLAMVVDVVISSY